MVCGLRWQDERCLRPVKLTRHGLHLRSCESLAVPHNSQRIVAISRRREDIKGDKLQAFGIGGQLAAL
jgi:hypothetical protein